VPKFPKPFFRAPRGLWYVQLDGKQINLGPDRDAAFASYHELMARPRPSRRPVATESVAAVLDAFLDWCQLHRAARTYKWYRDYLQSFVTSVPRGLTVDRLRPIHVQRWVDAQPPRPASPTAARLDSATGIGDSRTPVDLADGCTR